ncbi:hypothetical protein KAM348_27110 [Aeromonas caviae]|uniref:Cro/Cl family transcriptional regulator n=1 Tax=Aeromonas caviae TaxID=648 RepID=A0AAI9PAK3_AERCA|nr:Cro/CI family transcriptional regulator [Aeromonas caviae]GJA55288.1 hypothetical protein KAM348_27110 [Aeromonas caviae]
MKTNHAVEYFGSKVALAIAIGIHKAAVSQWGENVPKGRAYQLEVLTGGKLKADPAPPSGQERPYQRIAPGTALAEIPCVQRATDAAQTDATQAQPGKA